jgi:hypothetical protein
LDSPLIVLERQNVHGSQARVSDPARLAAKRVLVITGTADLDHARNIDEAIVTWLNAKRRQGRLLLPGRPRHRWQRPHADAGHERRDAIVGIILDWLETAGTMT